MPVPGISTPNVYVHAPGGRSTVEINWGESASASVVYRCDWGNAIDLMKELRGGFPTSVGGLITPAMPHAFPLIPELYCHAVSVKPKDDECVKGELSDPFAFHPHALITASYKSPDWSFDAAHAAQYPAVQIDPGFPIVGCRQRIRASTSFLVFEGAKLKFQTSGKVVESSDGIPANQVEIVLEYPRLRVDPTSFLLPFKGKVNDARLWFLDPEHVLFDSFEVDRQFAIGAVECSATLTFLGSLDLTWNERLNDTGEPEAVKFVSSSPAKKPFASTNLHAIF